GGSLSVGCQLCVFVWRSGKDRLRLSGLHQALSDLDTEAHCAKQTGQCEPKRRPEADDAQGRRKCRSAEEASVRWPPVVAVSCRCPDGSELGVHGLCSFLLVAFDSMKRSGRRHFQAGLTTPYHFLDFCPAGRTMARVTSVEARTSCCIRSRISSSTRTSESCAGDRG